MRDRALLLTGATGFLGQAVLARWLERTRRPAVLLVRADDDAAATARVTGLLAGLVGAERAQAAPIRVLAADLTTMRPRALADRIAATGLDVGEVVHAAANVAFDQPLPEARATNVAGTARMLELAGLLHDRAPLDRHVHVSTAFVAGDHRGRFGEDDGWIGQGFRNTYEQTKLEAEQLVVAAAGTRDLPVQIVRPSIVVGERDTGWTAAFNVLYVPLRALIAGAVEAVPDRDGGLLDVVPADYVADAILALRDAPADGRAYHLTAGRNAITVGELADLACRTSGRARPRRVHAEAFAQALRGSSYGRVLLANLGAYLPYLDVRTRFDASRAESHLRAHQLAAPPVAGYFDRLLAFAQESRWGRRRWSRTEALGALAT